MSDTSTHKRHAANAVDTRADTLIGLSHRIHAEPELGFAEHRASAWVADVLAAAGFTVEHGCYGLDTAVHARVGSGSVHVALCAEYDALPDLGHACGHNIIAAAAVGAGVGLAELADELDLTVSMLGTPAEEGGGGKALLLDRGAFDGVDAAMMVHPAPVELLTMAPTAIAQLDIRYDGVPAHAGSSAANGVNAADAMTIAQLAIGLQRQQLLTTDRVSGIVTEAGSAANVIPALSTGRWILRSDSTEGLAALDQRIRRCFEAGAHATGSTLTITPGGPEYADLRPDPEILALYQANAERLGRRFTPERADVLAGAATDMGNVSHRVPTIHPTLALDCLPAVNHTAEFAAACITPAADRAVLDGAKAMAWTAIDLAGSRAAG